MQTSARSSWPCTRTTTCATSARSAAGSTTERSASSRPSSTRIAWTRRRSSTRHGSRARCGRSRAWSSASSSPSGPTDGYLRQAAFKGIDIGKDPRTVVREREVSAEEAAEAAEAGGRSVRPQIGSTRARRQQSGQGWPTPARRRRDFEDPQTADDPPQAATPDEIAALDAMRKEGVWDDRRARRSSSPTSTRSCSPSPASPSATSSATT